MMQSPKMRIVLVMLVLLPPLCLGAEPVCTPNADGSTQLCKSRMGAIVTMAVFRGGNPVQTTQYNCDTYMMRTLDDPKGQWTAWYPVPNPPLGNKMVTELCKK